ncbi:hypothetical protein QBC47DRAFT_403233 [Echria macrotheca]|uniref:Uncharacterized protein n=1 Tax=Echria macrotheca TaxID=438768 RepID=A0AAJ0F4Q3_9PEZI|nr:hypothetical protein QBC47DRAFT_403233 [Echria macrotheca]
MPGQPALGMPSATPSPATLPSDDNPPRDQQPQSRLLASPAPENQQQQDQQPQRPFQRQRRPGQSLRSSILGGAAAPAPIRPSRLRASVETLVRKLSRHNLQSPTTAPSPPPPSEQPTSPPPPLPPPPIASPQPGDPKDGPPKLDENLLVVDDDNNNDDDDECWSAQQLLNDLNYRRSSSSRTLQQQHQHQQPPSRVFVPAATSAVPLDDADMLLLPRPPSAIVALRPSGVYYSYNLADHMDIHHDHHSDHLAGSGSDPAPAAIIPCSAADDDDMIESPVGNSCMALEIQLEVDESFCSNNDTVMSFDNTDDFLELDRARFESYLANRTARAPAPTGQMMAGSGAGTMMRRNVDGIPLRYRLSADAALRCQNLVRSKPRMRRRKKIMRAGAGGGGGGGGSGGDGERERMMGRERAGCGGGMSIGRQQPGQWQGPGQGQGPSSSAGDMGSR